VKPRAHKVYLPHHEDLLVLTVGHCICGWRVGYDASRYDDAVDAAQAHCASELAADLEAGPEWAQ
jgi:hypothetical protein